MIPIEQHLCNVMWKFIKVHTSEIKDTYEDLGFKSKTDMLNTIKVDWKTAWWALTELCVWGMKENYIDRFLVVEAGNYNIYRISGRFFKKFHYKDGIIEVKQKVKMIPVMDWEEVI